MQGMYPTSNTRDPGSGSASPSPEVAASFLQKRTRSRPALGVVLGSGFGRWTDCLEIECRVPYTAIPGFPDSTVPGHAGELLFATRNRIPLVVLNGRTHFYEGISLQRITFPIRVLAALGIQSVLLTNAAGAIRRGLSPGAFFRVTDHINGIGDNPLRGWDFRSGSPFVDMTQAYDPALGTALDLAAKDCGIDLPTGVYAAVQGPSYETPAEIRALALMGADAVGMSTVPEVIVARHCQIRVAALSCLTNWAAGVRGTDDRLQHTEVLAMGSTMAAQATRLLDAFLDRWDAWDAT